METVRRTGSGPEGTVRIGNRKISPPVYLHIADTIAGRLASGA